jgi:CpeT protein
LKINSLFMKYIFYVFFLFPTFAKAQFSKDLVKLSKIMQGHYSSELQSKTDTTFFDIRLKILPIWSERKDAIWMYVEQAMSGKEDKPYRQRVYRLTETSKGNFESAVYTLKSPLRFVGNLEMVNKLNPDSLILREGCAVLLKKVGRKKYLGATEYRKCSSDLRNATYATSEVTLTPKLLASWDRGYDANDKQVWGAIKSGYLFRKQKKK